MEDIFLVKDVFFIFMINYYLRINYISLILIVPKKTCTNVCSLQFAYLYNF